MRKLLSNRKRRSLAASARRAARLKPARRTLLLLDRVAAVRGGLIAIAVMLESVDDPDARWILEVEKLLTDGCESPLYNPDIHFSELQATLYHLCGGEARRWSRSLSVPSSPGATRCHGSGWRPA
jgi:hypothetical protein